MKPVLLPLIAVAALAAQPALALHKCVTKEGKTIYTEAECDKDARKSDVVIRDSAGVQPKKAVEPAKDAPKGAPANATAEKGAPPKKEIERPSGPNPWTAEEMQRRKEM